jgi:prepilin-type N-terminal cleavage/methylation domain-containing protein
MRPTPQSGQNPGFSLVEVLVAVTLLGISMMSLAGAATLGLSQMGKARQDLLYSADVQEVADSLIGAGWNKVTSGSSTIHGGSATWTATTLGPNSEKVDVVVTRQGQANALLVYSDTLTLYLAKSRVQ